MVTQGTRGQGAQARKQPGSPDAHTLGPKTGRAEPHVANAERPRAGQQDRRLRLSRAATEGHLLEGGGEGSRAGGQGQQGAEGASIVTAATRGGAEQKGPA